MDKVTYRQYQKLIRKGAWEKFNDKWGVLGSIVSLVVSILAGVVWWLFVGGIESVLVAAITLGIFIFVFAVFYTGFFNREHVYVYNKQASEMQSWVEKWGGEKIQTNHVTLNPEEDTRDKGNLRALLRVVNGEDYDLNGCYASAVMVREKRGRTWIDVTDQVNKDDEALTWPAHPKEKVTINKNGKSQVVSIAHISSGRILFTHLRHENKVGDGLQKQLYIEIEFSCTMNGKPIYPLLFKGFIIHKVTKKSERLFLELGGLTNDGT